MNTDKTYKPDKAEIVQELGKSYVRTAIRYDNDGYMIRMLTDNKIEGIPSCKKEAGTDTPILRYDVSNMKSLRREYEDRSMHFEDLKWLIYGISGIITTALTYLLDESMFIFDPDYIFIDMEDDSLNMIYVPGCGEESDRGSGYRSLADFILDKTDHKEESAVSIAYRFYKMSKEELFSIVSFCSLLNKEQPEISEKNLRNGLYLSSVKADELSHEYDNDPFSHDKEEREPDDVKREAKVGKIRAHLSFIITLILLLTEALIYITFGRSSVYALQFTTLIIMTGIAMIIMIICEMINSVRRKKDKELELEMSARSVSVNEYWGGDEETTFFNDEKTMFFDTEVGRDHTLVWCENGEEKKEILKGNIVTLGKKFDEVDICITDPTVSRKHARMMIKGDDIYVQDMGSTNGTYVDGLKIEPGIDIRLRENKDFLLGRVQVRVV